MSKKLTNNTEKHTLTRAELADAVHNSVGLSRTECSHLVETVLEEICKSLVAGINVKLSSFGAFMVREKGERIGRNPKTGKEVAITPRRVMVYKPSALLKQDINEALVKKC